MKEDKLVEDFVELYIDRPEIYSLVKENIQPVSGIVLHFSQEDVEFVKPASILRTLYDRESGNISESFSDEQDYEDLEIINRVMEYGVSKSDSVSQYRRHHSPRYQLINFEQEDHIELINAVNEADYKVGKIQLWEQRIGEEADDFNWRKLLEDESPRETEERGYDEGIQTFR